MRDLRNEDGFSVIEGVVAAMLLMIGAIAVLGAMDAGTRNTFRAEQSQVVANRLQAELEEIRSIPYKQLAIAPSAVPAPSTDASLPTHRIGTTLTGPTFALERSGSSPRPIVTSADAAAVNPGPEPFQSGDVSGVVYRFVVHTDANDPHMKRIIVAIHLDSTAAAFSRSYQEIHTDVVDPDATPASNPLPGTGGGDNDDAPGQFFLTGTPCQLSERQPITADHPTQNTRGRCEDAASSSSSRGPAGLMLNELPPAGQEEYSYSSELSSATGLTMRPVSSTSCGLSYHSVDVDGVLHDGPLDIDLESAEGDHQKLRKWVSPPVPSASTLSLAGDGTLKLWTRGDGLTTHAGTVCVWLFERGVGEVLGLPIDRPILGSPALLSCPDSEQCTGGWPQQWTEVSVPLGPFAPTELAAGERLGVAITVTGTSGNNVQFQYDHPSFDSRLELTTAAPLPF